MKPMKVTPKRLPREETERVADAYAEHLGIDPDRVRCDFGQAVIEVPIEVLAKLLGIAPPVQA